MTVNELLQLIESNGYEVELTFHMDNSTDVVIFATIVLNNYEYNGFNRSKYSFRENDQNTLLKGLAQIINRGNHLV